MKKERGVALKAEMEQWQSVILENRAKYYRLAYSYVKNEHDALDIVQESLYKALRDYSKMRDEDAIKTWFYRIVVNTALNFIKKSKRVVYMNEAQWNALPGESEEDAVSLRDAVDSLPPRDKTVVTLRYFEDMKIGDIAKVLQENENTIKTRLYAALKKLKVSVLREQEV